VGLAVLAESRDTSGEHRWDLPGLAALAAGLFALVFGMIKAQGWGWGSGRTIGFLAAAVVLLAAFAFVESRSRAPLVPLRLFRSVSLSLSTIIVTLTFFALFGVLFFVTLYLQNVHGYSAIQAGVRTLPLSGLFMLSSPLGAALNQRFGPRAPIALGMVLITTAFIVLTQLGTDSSYNLLWPPFVAIGLGVGMVITAASDTIVSNASPAASSRRRCSSAGCWARRCSAPCWPAGSGPSWSTSWSRPGCRPARHRGSPPRKRSSARVWCPRPPARPTRSGRRSRRVRTPRS